MFLIWLGFFAYLTSSQQTNFMDKLAEEFKLLSLVENCQKIILCEKTGNRQICQRDVYPGTIYCEFHNGPRCDVTTDRKQRCRNPAIPPSNLCKFHTGPRCGHRTRKGTPCRNPKNDCEWHP